MSFVSILPRTTILHFSQEFCTSVAESRIICNAEKKSFQKDLNNKKNVSLIQKMEGLDTHEEVQNFITKHKSDLQKEIQGSSIEKENQKKTEIESLKKDISAGLDGLRSKIEVMDTHSKKILKLAENFKSKLSPSHLLMIEDIVPGTLKTLFTKGSDGQRKEIDFAGNTKAEAIIGLGDMLDISQTYVCVYDVRTGKNEYGVRGIYKGRPGYINVKTGKYIEIFSRYQVEEVSRKTIENNGLSDMKQKDEENQYIAFTSEKEEDQLHYISANNEAKKKWAIRANEIQNSFIPDNEKVEVSSGVLGPLQDIIASGEGNWNSFNRGKAGDSRGKRMNLTTMTLGQIQALQNLDKGDKGRLFAVGRYQFIPHTLSAAMEARGISASQKFTPDIQNELFKYLVFKKRPVVGGYLTGRSQNIKGAMLGLAREFASVPLENGRGVYDGDSAENKAFGGISRYHKIKGILEQTRESITRKTESQKNTKAVDTTKSHILKNTSDSGKSET